MGRPISLEEVKASLEQTDEDRIYLKVGVFDVRLVHTDEGIVVDIFPYSPEGGLDTIASTYAFDADCDPEEIEARDAEHPRMG